MVDSGSPDPLKEAASATIAVEEAPREKTKRKNSSPKKDPSWNVVLWNDDDHTQKYVVEMLISVFRHPFDTAEVIMRKVDRDGRAIALTCHKELAELKRDQVIHYGDDPYAENCNYPLRATIEPAPE